MICPACGFDNQKNKNVCRQCGSDLHSRLPDEYTPIQPAPGSAPIQPAGGYAEPRPAPKMSFFSRLLSALFSCLAYAIFLLLILITILALLILQCHLNIPNPPAWEFMPAAIAEYWDWADDWQMERCPDLAEDNYLFGSEPLPIFNNQGGMPIEIEPVCRPGTINFAPRSAPVGSTFSITLEGFVPNEPLRACWYFPSTTLVNCADLEADAFGKTDTVYWSGENEPRGKYTMEVESLCGLVTANWTVE